MRKEERESISRGPVLDFDEHFPEGVFVVLSDPPNIRFREACAYRNKVGRPLTNVEMGMFERA